jgi:hypothetical protein
MLLSKLNDEALSSHCSCFDSSKNVLTKRLLERTNSAVERKTSASRRSITKHSTVSEATGAGRYDNVVGRSVVSAKHAVCKTTGISVHGAIGCRTRRCGDGSG